jgi:hypothetical protein
MKHGVAVPDVKAHCYCPAIQFELVRVKPSVFSHLASHIAVQTGSPLVKDCGHPVFTLPSELFKVEISLEQVV